MKKHMIKIIVEEIKGTENGVMTGVSVNFMGNPYILGTVIGQIMEEKDGIKDMIEIAMSEYLSNNLPDLDDSMKETKLKKGDHVIN